MRRSPAQVLTVISLLLAVAYLSLSALDGRLFASPLDSGWIAIPRGPLAWLRSILGLFCVFAFPGMVIVLSRGRRQTPGSRGIAEKREAQSNGDSRSAVETQRTQGDQRNGPGSEARDRQASPEAREFFGVFLEAFGISVATHILNLSLVKLLGLTVSPALIMGLGIAEAAIIYQILSRRGEPGELRPFSRDEWMGLGLVGCMVVGLGMANLGFAGRELGDYWYSAELEEASGREEPFHLEAAGITIDRGPGWEELNDGERSFFRKLEVTHAEHITLRALTASRLTLRYLWQGPVDSSLTIDCGELQSSEAVEKAPIELPEEGATLRYLDDGIVLVSLPLTVRDKRSCTLRPQETEGQVGVLAELTGWPPDELPDLRAYMGWSQVHYYQILNIAENIEWARNTLVDQLVTINQPPLWSYIYSAIVLYVGNGLWAVNLFFFALVGLLVWAAVKVVESEHERLPFFLWLPIGLLGVSHARIIIASSSTNFPDNLYAFGLVAMCYALTRGREGLFSGAGLATTLLRYSGSGLSILAPLLMLRTHPGRRRATLRALLWWVATIGLLCLAFLIVGAVTGQLQHWLEILYFETFPEHFHGQYDIRELLHRPPEFYGMLLQYAGFTPVLLLFVRGRLARWAAGLALLYSLLLCFIDHFPSHYFVPLLYLIGIALTATLMGLRRWQRYLALTLSCAGLLYGLTMPL